jgi:predicted short-subunit dehydrogenase-like oxidoreductase (DUF2520 family)
MLTINCIGAGRLGKSILRLLYINKASKICGVYDSSFSNSIVAINFIGSGVACKSLQDIPLSDIYLISVPDDQIPSVCKELVDQKNLKNSSVTIIHCSGARSSKDLSYAEEYGCFVASIHPIVSFAIPEIAVNSFKGVYCGLEGSKDACKIVKTLFEKIGGFVFLINGDKKSLYHAAIVLSNNYLTTLHYYSRFLFNEAGVKEEISKHLLMEMMSGSLENLRYLDEKNALTGLIQRGDINTLKEEIMHLKNYHLIRKIYCLLGKATISLTKHNKEIKEKLKNCCK